MQLETRYGSRPRSARARRHTNALTLVAALAVLALVTGCDETGGAIEEEDLADVASDTAGTDTRDASGADTREDTAPSDTATPSDTGDDAPDDTASDMADVFTPPCAPTMLPPVLESQRVHPGLVFMDAVWQGEQLNALVVGEFAESPAIATYDRSGTETDFRGPIPGMRADTEPYVAFNGSEFGMMWLVTELDRMNGITFLGASDTFEPRPPGVGLVTEVTGGAPGAHWPVELLAVDQNFVAVWFEDGRNALHFTTVSPMAEVLDDIVVLEGEATSDASVIWTGTEYALVWSATTSSGDGTFFARVAPDGTTTTPVEISPEARSGQAAIATHPDGFAVVYPVVGQLLAFARIQDSGQLIGTETIVDRPMAFPSMVRIYGGYAVAAQSDGPTSISHLFFGTDGELLVDTTAVDTAQSDLLPKLFDIGGETVALFWSPHSDADGYDSRLVMGNIPCE